MNHCWVNSINISMLDSITNINNSIVIHAFCR